MEHFCRHVSDENGQWIASTESWDDLPYVFVWTNNEGKQRWFDEHFNELSVPAGYYEYRRSFIHGFEPEVIA